MKNMYHHKKTNGGLDFIGWDDEKGIYSTQYYANVGITNSGDSKHTTFKEIKRLTQWCINQGYVEKMYL